MSRETKLLLGLFRSWSKVFDRKLSYWVKTKKWSEELDQLENATLEEMGNILLVAQAKEIFQKGD